MVNSLRDDSRVVSLVERLHAASDAQLAETSAFLSAGGRRSTIGTEADWEAGRAFWRDKYVALNRDKAELCYALCRASGATRVVEAGTSFGVSTIYLAAAVRDNGGGTVIATEVEPEKAAIARQHFEESGLDSVIELREGDLRTTLRDDLGTVDFLLLDIWVMMVRQTIELVAPRMRTGGIVIADNSIARRDAYAELFDFLTNPTHGFSTMTLPFDGGLELAVKTN